MPSATAAAYRVPLAVSQAACGRESLLLSLEGEHHLHLAFSQLYGKVHRLVCVGQQAKQAVLEEGAELKRYVETKGEKRKGSKSVLYTVSSSRLR